MALTFTEAKTALDEIADRSTQNSKRLANAKTLLAQAQSDLAAMPGTYSSIISDINAEAAANPSDDAWTLAKAEKDQMVSDFQALKTEVDAVIAAVDAVGNPGP